MRRRYATVPGFTGESAVYRGTWRSASYSLGMAPPKRMVFAQECQIRGHQECDVMQDYVCYSDWFPPCRATGLPYHANCHDVVDGIDCSTGATGGGGGNGDSDPVVQRCVASMNRELGVCKRKGCFDDCEECVLTAISRCSSCIGPGADGHCRARLDVISRDCLPKPPCPPLPPWAPPPNWA